MAVIKVSFVIAELFFEIINKEKLLTMHIASSNGIKIIILILYYFFYIALALGFATFGASDFLDFLKSYLIGLSRILFEFEGNYLIF